MSASPTGSSASSATISTTAAVDNHDHNPDDNLSPTKSSPASSVLEASSVSPLTPQSGLREEITTGDAEANQDDQATNQAGGEQEEEQEE